MKLIVEGNHTFDVLRNVLSPHSTVRNISGSRAVCNDTIVNISCSYSLAKKVNKSQQLFKAYSVIVTSMFTCFLT